MDLVEIKLDVVKAGRVLHQQGIAAAFGHVSARIPGTDTLSFRHDSARLWSVSIICSSWMLKAIKSLVLADQY